MTNHADLARQCLASSIDLREAFRLAQNAKPKDHARIAVLASDQHYAFESARLHADLAQVQAIDDLRAEVTRLIDDLTGVPDPRPALSLVNPEGSPIAALLGHFGIKGDFVIADDGAES